MDDELDEIDYRARLVNERRLPKPILRCKPPLEDHLLIGSKMTAPHLRLAQVYNNGCFPTANQAANK